MKSLREAGKYVQCLFFAHLVLEKWLKAHWVKDNANDYPPKTHHLVRLSQSTKLNLSEDDLVFLEEFNDFQLEGRYPDYAFSIQKKCTSDYTDTLLNKIKFLKSCLQDQMP